MKKNYYVLIGTIAEFIKLLPILKEFDRRNIPYKIISTGQNNIDDIDLFDEIKHKKIDLILNNSPKHQTSQSLFIWWVKTFFVGLLKINKLKSNNNYLIIHGDTISTLLGSILGKIFGFKITHIESGLRSNNYLSPFPEEIDRIVVSKIADIHFAPNSWAYDNLKKVKGERVNTVSNTLIESLAIALKQKKELSITLPKKYFVFVIHRQENLIDKKFVSSIVGKIYEESSKIHCIFIVHGNTLHTLKSLSLYDSLVKNRHITLLERVPYFNFMKILNKAEYLITDGGSNQEESSYMGLPTFIIRENTERIEGLNSNVLLGGKNLSLLNKFIKNYKKYKKGSVLIKSTPSSIIVNFLEKK